MTDDRKDSAEPCLTHVDASGAARMVDVSTKASTVRLARASARVRMATDVRARVFDGTMEKGEVLAVARLAGIQGAKETSRLVPLCHPLSLSHVQVDFTAVGEDSIGIVAEARTTGPTGVEMEAMTAAAVAALTIYDMVKGACRDACIEEVSLLHKSGGKSGTYDRHETK
ncbi:MAG: cyclic pyranopterin monophosphate synthase MoaC [Planctomycetota bacterium]